MYLVFLSIFNASVHPYSVLQLSCSFSDTGISFIVFCYFKLSVQWIATLSELHPSVTLMDCCEASLETVSAVL